LDRSRDHDWVGSYLFYSSDYITVYFTTAKYIISSLSIINLVEHVKGSYLSGWISYLRMSERPDFDRRYKFLNSEKMLERYFMKKAARR
jgi:hypothetical protein